MENNVVTKKILNSKEAREYLGISRYHFEKAVSEGGVQFKLIGNKKFFPIWALDRWQNDTTNHTGYTKEAKSTIHISRSSLKLDCESNFVALQDKYFPKKQHSFA